jgi:hypothetical protein
MDTQSLIEDIYDCFGMDSPLVKEYFNEDKKTGGDDGNNDNDLVNEDDIDLNDLIEETNIINIEDSTTDNDDKYFEQGDINSFVEEQMIDKYVDNDKVIEELDSYIKSIIKQ